MPLDTASVDTQIQIIKSDNVALSVVKDLHLNEDPEFISPRAGLIGTVIGLISNAAYQFDIPLFSLQICPASRHQNCKSCRALWALFNHASTLSALGSLTR